jgi:SAM-dependent methyltransferase
MNAVNTLTSFKSHLTLAKKLWKELLSPQDHAIDATCGNGYDTLELARLLPQGKVWAFDIQPQAIQNTKNKLASAARDHLVELHQTSHAPFPKEIPLKSIALIVYNLGYLPGSDKQITTQVKSTLTSIQSGLPLLAPGGALSITLYPGHEEGGREKQAVLAFAETLDPNLWQVSHFQPERASAPSLLWIQNLSIPK